MRYTKVVLTLSWSLPGCNLMSRHSAGSRLLKGYWSANIGPVYAVYSDIYAGVKFLYLPCKYVTDYRHCVETQDRHLEGSKTASTPPYILLADQYCLQITVPISATYYPIMSYYFHLLCVYIEPLELYSQLSRSCNSIHCKAYSYEPGSYYLLSH